MSEDRIHVDQSKPYTFELRGGPSDGMSCRTDSNDPDEQNEAKMILVMTKNGTIGKGFKGRAPGVPLSFLFRGLKETPEGTIEGALMQAHEYRVVDRTEEDDRVLVRLEYKGVGAGK